MTLVLIASHIAAFLTGYLGHKLWTAYAKKLAAKAEAEAAALKSSAVAQATKVL